MTPKEVPFAFFGTPYVARDTLAALMDAGFTPKLVITSPDAPKGRGMKLTACDTKAYAVERGLPVLSPDKLDEHFLVALSSYGCRYAVVVAYGKILPQSVIDAFPLGIVNVHYSLLPQYRGASPVEAALLAGDLGTGVTIQRMVRKMDAGDVLAVRAVPIAGSDTIRELRPRLIAEGASLLIETLPALVDGTVTAVPQDESQATFSPKILKEQGRLSLTGDPLGNWRTYRAFLESPGTFFYAAKGDARIRVKIARARYENDAFVIERIVPEGKSELDFSWLAENGWQPE